MKHLVSLAIVCLIAVPQVAGQPKPVTLATGLEDPAGIAVGPGGKIYVTVGGDLVKEGKGAVVVIDKNKPMRFATGLDAPKGITAFQNWLFVADRQRVWRIDAKGKADVFAPASGFPSRPKFLDGITVDPESEMVYVGGCDLDGKGVIYRISPRGMVSVVVDAKRLPTLGMPSGLRMDGASHLLAVDYGNGEIRRIKLSNGSTELLAEGLSAPTGLAWDHYGRLFVCEVKGSGLLVIPRPGAKPVKMGISGFQSPDGICLDPSGKSVLVLDTTAGTLTSIPIAIPGHEVDETPLPLHTEVAFPDLQWTGWKGETDSGKINPLRPIVLTHAGDGSNRVFVATQHGVIHSFPNDQKAKATTVFLDIQDRVSYDDKQNEEGFLGLAFHPKFKENGELFVFYTVKNPKLTNIVSRFKVRRDDPTRADPASEEEIIRFTKPFWNHDGGTVCFGPDGYLYVTHGDGGSGNDPYDNGQKMNSWLGKILRLDVDSPNRISKVKNYAIPKDNPFVGKEGVCPEIWASGLRNVWRMAFDRETGQLWAGEVGQNLYEEINLIKRGGNYGWNRRESLHPFGPKGSGPKPEFIDPIWEYHHDLGKSITGGHVYRGPRLPELTGSYLYADYVSCKIWALKHDAKKDRVVANRPIKDRTLPIFSFGEDAQGEVYLLTPTTSGQGIYWFVKS